MHVTFEKHSPEAVVGICSGLYIAGGACKQHPQALPPKTPIPIGQKDWALELFRSSTCSQAGAVTYKASKTSNEAELIKL